MLCWIFFLPHPSICETKDTVTITKDRAFSLAKSFFKDKDVDYYIRSTEGKTWSIFIDAEPMKGWNHECYLYSIPKTLSDSNKMSSKIYNAWERGGLKSQNMQVLYSNSEDEKLHKVQFMSPQSKLQCISLDENEFDIVKVKFNFSSVSSQGTIYTFDLIQKDENGTIVGGETFVVESPINE